MRFWLRFAIRSCFRRRRRTGIILVGIAFSIAALVVLGGIMVGVNDTMVRNAVALHAGHVAITGGPATAGAADVRVQHLRARVAENPMVLLALARCAFPALAQSPSASQPVMAKMVEPDSEADHTPLARCIVQGHGLQAPRDLLLGSAGADALRVSVGDAIRLTTPAGVYEYHVSGIYDTGVNALDQSLVFIDLAALSSLREPQVSYEVACFAKTGVDPAQLSERLEPLLEPGESAAPWRKMLPDVAQLVELNEFSMLIVIVLAVAILAFGVANALLISVMDRYRSFAILKAIGVRPREIATLILLEALVMCLAAGLLGTLLGVAASAAWASVGIDLARYTSYNPHFSIDPTVYPRLTWLVALGPQALALVAATLSAIWPAMVAARREVTQGMREL